MIRHTFLVILLITALGLPAQSQDKVHLDSTSTVNRPVFTVTEIPPQFPGGMNQLGEYLRKNRRYPETARKAGREGRVFVSFIITEQGGIEQASVLKSLDPELDAEALRLIKTMPTWTPAKQGGQPVACRFNLPVNFKINQ